MSSRVEDQNRVNPSEPPAPLLQVEGPGHDRVINGRNYNAVDHVSFDVGQGEVLGLVGESAAGKSMTALSIIRLVRPPAASLGSRPLRRDRSADALRAGDEQLRAVRSRWSHKIR